MNKREFELVRKLGEEIGYGNMMQIANCLWRKNLKENGFPESGAHISVSSPMIKKSDLYIVENSKAIYDGWYKELYEK